MRDALVLDAVSKVYEVGGVELIALHEVDLTVAEEEVVTLLGPSGSGKTTLLSIAGGLLSATTGRVVVGGKDITRARARKLTAFRRKRIGFIFQAVNLVPFLTARENLLVVAELARRDRSAAVRRADRLLEELGLGHRMNNLPSQLSGGERQRVAIGRALMNQPALVLVDEPTSALDSDLGQQVMELIVSEVKARGAAAVIVTHDQRMARYGDRILSMADGRIAGMAPRPEFTLGRGPAPAAALEAGPDVRALPTASVSASASAGAVGFRRPATPPRSGRIPAVGAPPPAPAAPAARAPEAGPPPFPDHGAAPPRRDTGSVPVGLWANGPAVSTPAPAPAPAARAPDVDAAGPPPFPDHGAAPPRRDTGSVPVGLWANGPAVTPGVDHARRPAAPAEPPAHHTGPHTSTPRDFADFWGEDVPDDADRAPRSRTSGTGNPRTGQHPAARDGAAFAPGTGQHPAAYGPPSGQVPITGPPSGQMPVVPAPDRVWRRPSTPAPERPTRGRRPPPLRPAPTQPTGWSEPMPLPSAGWSDPAPEARSPIAEGWPEPEPPAAPTPPAPSADWGSPEFFAEPPPGPAPDDGVESDRARWLQQLTPPPTKAQPRPLALPDRPIWPTRYWAGEGEAPNGDEDPGADDYDYGEYDDEEP